jgi:hypothetical protein
LFSNNRSADKNYSWQIAVHDGDLRMDSRGTDSNPVLTNDTEDAPKIIPNTWHHVVARKTGAGAELYLGKRGALRKIGSHSQNPGGLQQYRLGVNRYTNSLYQMEVANVQIHREADVDLEKLNTQGPFFEASN